MLLTSVLAPDSRVLDVDARDPYLARQLAAEGVSRYLGLVRPELLHDVRAAAPELARRFHPLESVDQVPRSSTDLLVLRGDFDRLLWTPGRLERARHVAVPARRSLRIEQRLARGAGRAIRRLEPRGTARAGAERFDLLEVRRPAGARARHYLSPVWGVSGLVERLDAAGLSYVVLRWFEHLPELEPDEDLDVLVADRDLDALRALLAEEPGTIPVDLYSETGLPGSDYRSMAYYPPELARRMLAHAVVHESGARVPAPDDHLHSLAYHVAYHKGPCSGLPTQTPVAVATTPEHDYAAVLTRLARGSGVALTPTLEGVDEHLASVGWRPPADTLRRLAPENAWVAARFFANEDSAPDPPEPAVFLVRERAVDALGLERVVEVLERHGFEVLLQQELDPAAAARCATQLRGGNWGPGPMPVSGGAPAAVVVCAHYGPRPPEDELRAKYPRLSNMDVLDAKLALRALVEAEVGPGERFNPVHSSDDAGEAWEYVDQAVPERTEALRRQVEHLRAEFRTEVPVLAVLSSGRRAKVEVVQGEDGPVVRKTFTPGSRRFLEREIFARRQLAGELPAVPELLDHGPSWFTSPYYRDLLQDVWRSGRLVDLPVVREMVEVLRRLHDLGFDVLDAKPQNFVLDPDRGLKLVDLEFLHRHEGGSPPFRDSWCFVAPPPEFVGDVPLTDFDYDRRWRRFTGLRLSALIDGSPAQQRAGRAAFQLSPLAQGSRTRRTLGGLRPVLVAARDGAADGYDQLGRWRLAGVLPEPQGPHP